MVAKSAGCLIWAGSWERCLACLLFDGEEAEERMDIESCQNLNPGQTRNRSMIFLRKMFMHAHTVERNRDGVWRRRQRCSISGTDKDIERGMAWFALCVHSDDVSVSVTHQKGARQTCISGMAAFEA